MLTPLRNRRESHNLTAALIVSTVLVLAFLLGLRASPRWLGLLLTGLSALALLARPRLVPAALVIGALIVPLEFSTGTDVRLNPAALLVPALTLLWLLDSMRRGRVHLAASPVNLPLALFLAASLLSLLIGRATWDPLVPVKNNFLLVQLAQWAIFAFSALALWLTANLVTDERTLWRLTAFFLLLGGGVAILRVLPGLAWPLGRFTTAAFIRAPFWVLLTALAGGQLLWNRGLSLAWRLFLIATLLAALIYALVDQREAASNWVGIGAALGMLDWLRFPRLRWPLLALVLVLALAGVLFPVVYDFAGGDAEWELSGGSRLALSGRVTELTMRNPITGLGPAAYRPYGLTGSLQYGRAFYTSIALSSHNNYIDLFAHGGLLGLALFGWFVFEVARLGDRLHRRYSTGFAAAYVNGMTAAGVGALVIMMLADWILPFVYNIGYLGFQASVLVWLFLGGLVALEGMGEGERGREGERG